MSLDAQVRKLEKTLMTLDNNQARNARNRALNRSSKRLATLVSRDTAKTERLKVGLIKKKIRISQYRAKGLAVVVIGRTAIPAIKIGAARSQVKRRKGKNLISQAKRGERGRFAKREHAGNTAIKVGRHTFNNAFLQRLESGRWHIMQRTSDSRYPIDIAKVPIQQSITTAATKYSKNIIDEYLPTILIKDMNYRINKLLS
ncbi:phage tail protein [Pseudoalteromonas umbrosa]|uniref:phage tail protein n=1 Tax=Pseudoalteromonas umbrosa TaxID=3048489 RepID=UPI0024C35E32|nr:phage tail protein [Pseudoalteromonas sp. B95]MDK1289783.1 phage tail protein [Pseudoalteromonas sp. B95]